MIPDTFRVHVDDKIRFEYATCGWEYYLNPERKCCGSKRPGYVWTEPKSTATLCAEMRAERAAQLQYISLLTFHSQDLNGVSLN